MDYLEKLNGSAQDLVDILPEKKDFFDRVERNRRQLVNNLYLKFEYRYIKGKFLKLEREQ